MFYSQVTSSLKVLKAISAFCPLVGSSCRGRFTIFEGAQCVGDQFEYKYLEFYCLLAIFPGRGPLNGPLSSHTSPSVRVRASLAQSSVFVFGQYWVHHPRDRSDLCLASDFDRGRLGPSEALKQRDCLSDERKPAPIQGDCFDEMAKCRTHQPVGNTHPEPDCTLTSISEN